MLLIYMNEGGCILDKIVYTEEASKDELFKRLNDLLSEFIRELSSRENKKVDDE